MKALPVLALCLLPSSLMASPILRFPASISSDEEMGPELKNAMRQINTSMRMLGKLVDDKKNEDALGVLAQLQGAIATAKTQTPKKAEKLKGKEKEEFMMGFRTQLIELMRASLDLEVALLQGDEKAAKKALDQMGGMKSEGHKAYK